MAFYVFDLIFPKFCVGCNALGSLLCKRCKSRLSPDTDHSCIACRNPSHKGNTHIACKRTKHIPDQFLAAFNYTDTARKIIIKSKYPTANYKLIDKLIKTTHLVQTTGLLKSFDIIVPIPPSKKKNSIYYSNLPMHTSIFLSNKFDKPIVNAFNYYQFSKPQKLLNKQERFASVRRNIHIKNRLRQQIIKNKRILLIDDVCTSSATILHTSNLLRTFGAKSIIVFVLAIDRQEN